MILLLLLALIAVVVFGLAFAVHWLFVIAAILAVVWVVSFFMGGRRGRRRAWR